MNNHADAALVIVPQTDSRVLVDGHNRTADNIGAPKETGTW